MIVRHNDKKKSVLLIDNNHGHFSRCQGIIDIFSGIGAPGNDIDPFPLQFLHHILYPRPLQADTGSHWIDIGLNGRHGDLGAKTGLPAASHYLDDTLGNLRDFQFKELHKKLVAGTTEQQLRIPAFLAYFQQIGTNTITLLERPFGDLSLPGQDRIGSSQVDDHFPPFKTLDNTIDDGSLAITKHIIDNFALGIPHPVNNHLFCRLGGYPAEIGYIIKFLAEIIFQLNLRIQLPCLVQGNFRFLIKDLFHHRPVLKDLDLAEFFIKLHFNIPTAAELFPDR